MTAVDPKHFKRQQSSPTFGKVYEAVNAQCAELCGDKERMVDKDLIAEWALPLAEFVAATMMRQLGVADDTYEFAIGSNARTACTIAIAQRLHGQDKEPDSDLKKHKPAAEKIMRTLEATIKEQLQAAEPVLRL